MALEFHDLTEHAGRRLALFPGAFNPPTVAHLEIARAALAWADRVLWVLPRSLPHKTYEDAPFEDRLAMLERVTLSDSRFIPALASGGLYADIAAQAREALSKDTGIALVCGRDAAERIANWKYEREGVFDEMVAEFPLLVAARAGDYMPAAEHHGKILPLRMESSFDEVSSSEVRNRIVSGRPWRHLVPDPIHDMVARLYK